MTNTAIERAMPYYLRFNTPENATTAEKNCHIIRKMIAEKGVAFLGDIGGEIPGAIADVLSPYTEDSADYPQKRFCVPKYDRLLVDMIQAWRNTKDAAGFHAIRERIHNLGGVYLGLWEDVCL